MLTVVCRIRNKKLATRYFTGFLVNFLYLLAFEHITEREENWMMEHGLFSYILNKTLANFRWKQGRNLKEKNFEKKCDSWKWIFIPYKFFFWRLATDWRTRPYFFSQAISQFIWFRLSIPPQLVGLLLQHEREISCQQGNHGSVSNCSLVQGAEYLSWHTRFPEWVNLSTWYLVGCHYGPRNSMFHNRRKVQSPDPSQPNPRLLCANCCQRNTCRIKYYN